MIFMCSTLMLSGCVIPPTLSVSEDAGVNSPPAIIAVSSDQVVLPEPGPVAFEIGGNTDLSVSLIDTDTDDTLYVRLFVDYNTPDRLDARSKCSAGSGTARRTATCNLRSLCASTDLDTLRNLTVVVFDRLPDDSGKGDPPFQAMDARSGGLSTSRFYFLKCQPSSQP
jgi:hypothetical protein